MLSAFEKGTRVSFLSVSSYLNSLTRILLDSIFKIERPFIISFGCWSSIYKLIIIIQEVKRYKIYGGYLVFSRINHINLDLIINKLDIRKKRIQDGL